MRWILLAFGLLTVVGQIWAANILAVLPFFSKSHFMYSYTILVALAGRGHKVTLISSVAPSKPVPNLRYIPINTEQEQKVMGRMTFEAIKQITLHKSYFGFNAPRIWRVTFSTCEEVLKSEIIKDIIKSKDKYDLLVAEALFGQESLLVLGHLLNIPTVNMHSFSPWSIVNQAHGNSLQIATAPDTVSFPFSHEMNFEERFRNFVSTVLTLVYYNIIHIPSHQALIQKTFANSDIPHLSNLVSDISLSIVNYHPAVGYPLSLPPNIVPAPGVHISSEPQPISKDIQEFLDQGEKGVIYFSLGTVVPMHVVPQEMLQMFINVFAKLPYRVLWKINLDSLPNAPNNVKIAHWLPQQSILAHPNVKLFITHGGLLSLYETIYAGVPIIGMPFFGDQMLNVRLSEHLKMGTALNFFELTEQTFSDTISTVIDDSRYSENAKKWSKIYRHTPMSPIDTAVYWVEYVIRHNGSLHLRPTAATMPWYSIYLLDVIAAILLAVILLLTTLYVVFKLIIQSLSCGNKPVSKKKKTN